MLFKITANQFNNIGTWGVCLEDQVCPSISKLRKFDQSGYDLCELEQDYAVANNHTVSNMRYHTVLRQDWLEYQETTCGVHINHADLYERKGFHGYALEQLNNWAQGMPILYKMSKLKPKWGLDVSIDYADKNATVMELFHYEWDDFILDNVLEKKNILETILTTYDWEDIARTKISRKHEWEHLDFTGQSKWTTKFLGLPEERFKLTPWH